MPRDTSTPPPGRVRPRARAAPRPPRPPRLPRRRYVRFTRWRRRRFFALLEEGGNVQLAAELAGVGLGAIYRLRRVEPGFTERMDSAREKASARLGQGEDRPSTALCAVPLPSETRGGSDDGLVIRKGIGGRLRLMAAGTRWWTARHDAIFLGRLRVTGNATASARAAGFTKKAAYDRRDRLPSFARAWEAALDEAANRLQGRLVHEVLKGSPEMQPDSPAHEAAAEAAEWEPFDPWLAIWLLKFWQRQGKLERTRFGKGARSVPGSRPAPG